jgi:hypothetical protein
MGLRTWWRLTAVAALIGLVLPLVPARPVEAKAPPFDNRYFETIWRRNDQPVDLLVARPARSWTWGLGVPSNDLPKIGFEKYKEGTWDGGGKRLVQYFDKARMEITDQKPGEPDKVVVTNGLLVVDMVLGKVQVGDTEYENRDPATEAVAGDPARTANDDDDNDQAPTYESFADVASVPGKENERREENRIGQRVVATIDKDGDEDDLPSDSGLRDLVRIADYDETLGHNIPDVFDRFLKQQGTVWEENAYREATVFRQWPLIMGLPITEPYWIKTRVNRIERDVLVQLFQRRVLTYTPSNTAGYQVEMGNVGQHYYRWRYGTVSEDDDDTSAVRISRDSLKRTALTPTSAKIEWRTTRDATSRLEYGTDKNLDNSTVIGSTERKREHAVEITGLKAETTYYWRILSRDADGNTVKDSIHAFRTCLASQSSCN